MVPEWKDIIPQGFSPQSRVWIYQASRKLTIQEALFTDNKVSEFAEQWKSHGAPVKAFGTVLLGQFILLLADENSSTVSGCSTDGMVRMVQSLEAALKISLFDRQLLAFFVAEKVELLPMIQMPAAIESGLISADTLYFNNTVDTLQKLIDQWILPIRRSWLTSRFKFPVNI
jgi:hypothetical protein